MFKLGLVVLAGGQRVLAVRRPDRRLVQADIRTGGRAFRWLVRAVLRQAWRYFFVVPVVLFALLPLVAPLLVVAGLVWLIVRVTRPHASATAASH